MVHLLVRGNAGNSSPDATHDPLPGTAGAGGGGTLRDDQGVWKGGFSVRLANCSAIEAE